jgi:hypothetical protein
MGLVFARSLRRSNRMLALFMAVSMLFFGSFFTILTSYGEEEKIEIIGVVRYNDLETGFYEVEEEKDTTNEIDGAMADEDATDEDAIAEENEERSSGYRLVGEQDFAEFEGQKVRVSGTLNTDPSIYQRKAINVKSIQIVEESEEDLELKDGSVSTDEEGGIAGEAGFGSQEASMNAIMKLAARVIGGAEDETSGAGITGDAEVNDNNATTEGAIGDLSEEADVNEEGNLGGTIGGNANASASSSASAKAGFKFRISASGAGASGLVAGLLAALIPMLTMLMQVISKMFSNVFGTEETDAEGDEGGNLTDGFDMDDEAGADDEAELDDEAEADDEAELDDELEADDEPEVDDDNSEDEEN